MTFYSLKFPFRFVTYSVLMGCAVKFDWGGVESHEKSRKWVALIEASAAGYREAKGFTEGAVIHDRNKRREGQVACYRECKEISLQREGLHQKERPFVGDLKVAPGNIGLWMRGVGLIGGYLSEKYSLEGGSLLVSESLQAFQEEMKKIAESSQDRRVSFVVPCWMSEDIDERKNPQVQHKVAIGVDKRGKQLRVAIFDPFFLFLSGGLRDLCRMDPRKVRLPKPVLEKAVKDWSESDVQGKIVQMLFQAGVGSCTCDVLVSEVSRQSGGSCAVFALEDALSFLRSPHFFQEVAVDRKRKVLMHDRFVVSPMTQLPSPFMVISQNLRFLQAGKRRSDFVRFQGRMQRIEEAISPYMNSSKQNEYSSVKTVEYASILRAMLVTLSQEEIEGLEKKVLLRDKVLFPKK